MSGLFICRESKKKNVAQVTISLRELYEINYDRNNQVAHGTISLALFGSKFPASSETKPWTHPGSALATGSSSRLVNAAETNPWYGCLGRPRVCHPLPRIQC